MARVAKHRKRIPARKRAQPRRRVQVRRRRSTGARRAQPRRRVQVRRRISPSIRSVTPLPAVVQPVPQSPSPVAVVQPVPQPPSPVAVVQPVAQPARRFVPAPRPLPNEFFNIEMVFHKIKLENGQIVPDGTVTYTQEGNQNLTFLDIRDFVSGKTGYPDYSLIVNGLTPAQATNGTRLTTKFGRSALTSPLKIELVEVDAQIYLEMQALAQASGIRIFDSGYYRLLNTMRPFTMRLNAMNDQTLVSDLSSLIPSTNPLFNRIREAASQAGALNQDVKRAVFLEVGMIMTESLKSQTSERDNGIDMRHVVQSLRNTPGLGEILG